MAKPTKKKPLSGRSIAVTRAVEQSGELVSKLQDAGAEVLELPMIQIRPASDADQTKEVFKELWTYEWLVFTSANGVRHFFDLFFTFFNDIRAIGGVRIAVVGPGTQSALANYYLRADLIPEESTAEAVAKAMETEQTLDNLKVLIVTGSRNNDLLAERLEAAQAIVDSLQVYSTEMTDLSEHPGAKKFRDEGADAIIFASGSAVESFVNQAGAGSLKMAEGATRPAGCSIGPVTSESMRRLHVPVDVVAKEPTVDALVKGIVDFFKKRA